MSDHELAITELSKRMDSYHERICEDLKEIKLDIKETKAEVTETKQAVSLDIASLRREQDKCNSYWKVLTNTLSWGGFGTILTAIGSILGFGKNSGS